MEQHFRIALWMFCLVGYLQAKPCYHFNIDDLDFDNLLKDVSCVSYFMIKGMYSTSSPHVQANSNEFQRENKTFAVFVKDFESFLKQLNDNPKMC
uniref:Kit ligand n=1 Tax=Seriola lalandi dorsalis TaxID=1841481 RepID=A0A3B4YHK3_SERLL